MHEGIMGAGTDWDHDLVGLFTDPEEDEKEPGWDFIASQSYTFTASGEQALGRFFSFRFPDWKVIYGPESEPYIPMYQYFDLVDDPGEMNDIFEEIDWNEHVWPGVTEVLTAWASRQAAVDLGGLDPRMREELKALGYIDEGPVPVPDED